MQIAGALIGPRGHEEGLGCQDEDDDDECYYVTLSYYIIRLIAIHKYIFFIELPIYLLNYLFCNICCYCIHCYIHILWFLYYDIM